MAKKTTTAEILAKSERQAVEFTKDSLHIKKGTIQLVSKDMADLFVKRGIAKKVDVSESQFEAIIRNGKI